MADMGFIVLFVASMLLFSTKHPITGTLALVMAFVVVLATL